MSMMKKLIKRLVFLCLLLLILFLSRNLWLPGFGKVLLRDDHPKKGADAIVLMAGDFNNRPQEAARFYREKYAPRILLAPEEGNILVDLGLIRPRVEIAIAQLKRLGIPEEDIEIYSDRNVTSTLDEAVALRAHLEKNHPEAKRLLLVSSWSHTRRLGWIFDKVFEGSGRVIEVSPISFEKKAYARWWTNEEKFLKVFTEYLKWAWYLTQYGFLDSSELIEASSVSRGP